MLTHNPENERIKHRYFAYLREAQRRGEPSVDAAAKDAALSAASATHIFEKVPLGVGDRANAATAGTGDRRSGGTRRLLDDMMHRLASFRPRRHNLVTFLPRH
jgi:hypothetical protein